MFARVFGGSVVPELEALLRREASDGVQTLAGGRSLVPNDYVITLSVSDFQKLSADRDLTTEAFAKHLEEYIQEQGWQTYGGRRRPARRIREPAYRANIARTRPSTPTCIRPLTPARLPRQPDQQNRTMRTPQNEEHQR